MELMWLSDVSKKNSPFFSSDNKHVNYSHGPTQTKQVG